MHTMSRALTLAVAVGWVGCVSSARTSSVPQAPIPSSFFELETRSLEGEPVDLSQYAGKVVLVVNTASQCGQTPQYEGLEALYREKKSQDLVVLGFPSNDFLGQEPGTPAEIRKFCQLRYDVTFPMMEKVKTKGEEASEVYRFLSAQHGSPGWNFHKYLVGRAGRVVASFPSATEPDSPELRRAIEQALADKG